MNQFTHNQEVRTKLYKRERYSEFATPQSGRKLAIAQGVAVVFAPGFVYPSRRIAADTASSSRLAVRVKQPATRAENILN